MELAFLPSPNPLLLPSPSPPLPFNLPPKLSRHGHPFRVSASSNSGPPFRLPWQHLSQSFQRSSGRLWLNFGVIVKKETGFNFGVSASNASFVSSIPTAESSNQYDVFLSFRGSDTRKEFTDHLYHSLVNIGTIPIRVFRDENNIPIGEEFDSAILDAITRSKISIPIISISYASSEWCLRELIHMMECKKTMSHMVLPIFYKVKPSDLRYLKGDFGSNFHLQKQRFDEKVIQKGIQALRDVSYLKGWESKSIVDGHEGELIKLVVETVLRELRKHFQLDVPKQLVGLDGHMKEIMNWINSPSVNARMIGIYGMGGIGKTTLAKCIYNKLSDKFVHVSCLPDIRETTHRHGIVCLQSQLISDILKSKNEVSKFDDGINIIKSRFKGKKVLILLDDIDHKNQLNALARERNWFTSGSIIIVTTRNKVVLDQSEFEVDNKYELNEIDEKHSLLLFSRHAFRMDHPPREFEGISHDIISTMGGLPLALEVIGSYLYGKTNQKVWEDMLRKLKKEPNQDVKEILKISYEALENAHKEIFLDIACFLIGKESKFAIYMWEDCGFYASLGIEELKLRCLIKIDNDGKLRMHDQLRDLGRNVVQEEGPLERRSRLWLYEEAFEVLMGEKGTKRIQAIYLEGDPGHFQTYTNKQFENLRSLRFLQFGQAALRGNFNKVFPELRWLHWYGFREKEILTTNLPLSKLVVLQLSSPIITEGWKGWSSILAAKRLKVLDLSQCSSLKELPTSIGSLRKLEKLIGINCYSSREITHSVGNLSSLQHLNLKGCESLIELPSSIGKLFSLQHLNLEGCKSLRELPSSIGDLSSLQHLNLAGCESLRELPSSIGNLSSLQHLGLAYCQSLRELPSSIGNLSSLQHLDLARYELLRELFSLMGNIYSTKHLHLLGRELLRELPDSLGNLSSLQHLNLAGDRSLKELPSSIGNLSSLQHLNLLCCDSLRELPSSIGNLSSLQHLNLLYCESLRELPSSIGNLSSLQHLDLAGCESLTELPSSIGNLSSLPHLDLEGLSLTELPSLSGNFASLKYLNLRNCRPLRKISSSIGNFSSLQHLDLEGCVSLEGLPSSIGNLSSLKYLNLMNCQSMEKIPSSIGNLSSLQNLDLRECWSLREIPSSIGNLSTLQHIELWNCRSLREIPSSIGDLENLQCLDISYSAIEQLPNGIGRLKNLRRLILRFCRSLKRKIPSEIGDLSSLEILEITHAPIHNLPKSIQNLSSLKHLNLWNCNKLKLLPELPSSLTHLTVSCHSPKLPQLSHLIYLEELRLDQCDLLEYIPELPSRPLKLYVDSCHKLMPKLDEFKYLELLSIVKCNSLERLDLSHLNRLKQLYIEDCNNLVEIQGHDHLECLKTIVIRYCQSIRRLILQELRCLKLLKANFCGNLVEIRGLDKAEFLKMLDISNCGSIERLPDLSSSTTLEALKTDGCDNLRGIDSLD
ncbi:hypothetical protein BT93_B1326 [Corymbia citriodora subsp. variegata]|nr:hypothetical protein BT93_B1326 [Corymbia citriodora subsp. variegata]KAF8038741.1 hypothetical protein BT93_B1326 [Corymbia citriodora subsp. variegata]